MWSRIGVRACLVLSLVAAGCGGGSEKRHDLGDAAVFDSGAGASDSGGAGSDSTAGDAATTSPDGRQLAAEGQACTLGNECASGFCADGVCCRTDCSGACQTCAGVGSVGTCIPAAPGTDPRNECPDDGATSCGHDGQCDGAGACRFYPAGLACKDPSCSGSTLTGASRCDGRGACVPSFGQPCDPYMCGTTGQCRTTCNTDADCKAGSVCTNNSCGKAPLGATCGSDDDCNSNLCQQGVCCATACTGTCRSCAVPGSLGTCTNVPAGVDPLGQCADSGAATCGTDGTCDGTGGCRKYAVGTQCAPPSCAGVTETLPGRCAADGTCAAGALQNCYPYVCGTAGTCLAICTTNADCAAGNVCNGGICAKLTNGSACTAAADCASNFCEQGVCCASGCSGLCQACNLAGTVGTCTFVARGSDPLNQCPVAAAGTCGTDGSCDGAGKCGLTASGTQCAAPSCSGSTATLAGRCDGLGACAPGTTQTCSPFVCGGGGACLITCSTNADCTAGNVCTAMSCGLKPLGAACAVGTECGSGLCQQGVCCGTTCTGTCRSCALAGSAGTCSNVPAGQDPLNQCTDQGAATCGNDGTCDGGGACRNYLAGTQCAPGSCTGSTFTAPRTCNGTGTCQAAVTSSCGAFLCDTANGVCRVTCTADADCVSPNICNGGVCTKKPLGQTCATAAECASGSCQQGVCCASSCTGTCRSCALTGSVGTCTNVPNGQDPLSQCTDQGAASCGTDGSCNGAGACRLYANGTQCAASTCVTSTFMPTRTCDGAGVCRTVTSSLCTPFACDTAAGVCKTTCTVNADCVAPATCMNGTCGLLPTGATCSTSAECNSGNCAQGVCCATACTGTCRSCALAGSVGTCATVPAGQDPLNQCTDQGATSCGTNGFCNGGGACQLYANGTQCAAQSCAGSTLSAARTCDGAGTCRAAATSSCNPYVCGPTACRTSCTSNADCLAPNVCTGTTCGAASNLKVQYHPRDTDTGDAWVMPDFNIVNLAATAVPLSELTIKYWFTIDSVQTLTLFCDFATVTCTNTATAFQTLSPARTNADRALVVTFLPAAGSVPANGQTADLQFRFGKTDFTALVETNDYSFQSGASFVDAPHVTLYRNGTIVWGTEPP